MTEPNVSVGNDIAWERAQLAKHSSASVEHYTPADIIERARAVMGGIDLDPASSAVANAKLVKATAYLDAEANGYLRGWKGRVWLNPPGGKCDPDGLPLRQVKGHKGYFYADGSRCTRPAQSSASAWWHKLVTEYRAGRVTEACFLGFSLEILQTSQTRIGSTAAGVFSLCFVAKRIAFLKVDGDELVSGDAPPHANVIVYIGEEKMAFERAFASLGTCRA